MHVLRHSTLIYPFVILVPISVCRRLLIFLIAWACRMPPVRGTSQKATVRAGPSSSSTAAAKPAEKRRWLALNVGMTDGGLRLNSSC